MISCKHAKQLFDRYLDGELTPSMQSELHAHQIACSPCQSELAVLEACGDVIRLDHREPMLGDSFTDNVLAALPKSSTIRPRKWFHSGSLNGRASWRRRALTVVMPLAAAASIALAAVVTSPSFEAPQKTVILGGDSVVAMPAIVQNAMMEASDSQLSPERKQALDDTPQMSAVHFMDALLKPVVEQAQVTLDGARSSASQVELLIQMDLAQPTEQLAAEWRTQQESHDGNSLRAAPTQGDSPLELINPAQLSPSTPAETSSEPQVLEAL